MIPVIESRDFDDELKSLENSLYALLTIDLFQ